MKAAQIVSYNKNNIALTVTDVPAPAPAHSRYSSRSAPQASTPSTT